MSIDILLGGSSDLMMGWDGWVVPCGQVVVSCIPCSTFLGIFHRKLHLLFGWFQFSHLIDSCGFFFWVG